MKSKIGITHYKQSFLKSILHWIWYMCGKYSKFPKELKNKFL